MKCCLIKQCRCALFHYPCPLQKQNGFDSYLNPKNNAHPLPPPPSTHTFASLHQAMSYLIISRSEFSSRMWLGAFMLRFQYKNIPWSVLLLAYMTALQMPLLQKWLVAVFIVESHLKPGDQSALHFILNIQNGRVSIKQNLSLKNWNVL